MGQNSSKVGGGLLIAAVVAGIAGEIISANKEEEETRRNAEIIRAMPIKRGNNKEEYYCPISGELMEDPVMSIHGYCYERKQIEEVIKNTGKCPNTRKPLKITQLASRPELKRDNY